MSAETKGVKRRRRGRKLLIVFAAIALFTVGCNTVASRMVNYEDKHVARNADGIMIGAEARELGDPNAPNAALFVHGFAGAGTNFNQLPQKFADAGWYVRVMRLPGHGTSPRDLEKVTADELESAVLDEVVQIKKNHSRVVLVGHSMGGALCALAASKGNVDGLIFGGAYFGVTYKWYYILPPETWTRLSSHVIRWVYKGGLFTQVNNRSQVPNILSYTWIPTKAGVTLNELGTRVNRRDVLAKISCPVLMFHSHGDVAAAPKAAEKSFDAMVSTEKTLLWVDKSNHHVYWDYDADFILNKALEFAARIEKRSPELNANPIDFSKLWLYDRGYLRL